MQLPEIGRNALGKFGADLVQKLIAIARFAYRLAQLGAGFGRGVAEIFLQRGIFWAQHIFIDIAVLNDQRGNPLGPANGEPKANLKEPKSCK